MDSHLNKILEPICCAMQHAICDDVYKLICSIHILVEVIEYCGQRTLQLVQILVHDKNYDDGSNNVDTLLLLK